MNLVVDAYTGCNWQSIDSHAIDIQYSAVTIYVDFFDVGGTGGWIGTANINGVKYNTNSYLICIPGG